ncbi:MAG: hypothetical protein U5L04_09050 [Trueperaceae bacterium]|nr:hypothetical protein [Trueperaceae bacterium]
MTQATSSDSLGLDGQTVDMGSSVNTTGLVSMATAPQSVGTTGIATQEEEEEEEDGEGSSTMTGTYTGTFSDDTSLASNDEEDVVSWSETLGFDDTVVITPPASFTGTLPNSFEFSEGDFTITVSDQSSSTSYTLALEPDEESTLTLSKDSNGDYTFGSGASAFTTLLVEGEDAQDFFSVLTTGSSTNDVTVSFDLTFAEEEDSNTSLPSGTTFGFTLKTSGGLFNIQ